MCKKGNYVINVGLAHCYKEFISLLTFLSCEYSLCIHMFYFNIILVI